MTLTLPHSGDIVRDLKVLSSVWKLFRRWLWLFFEHEHRLDRDTLKRIAFVRVLEVTAGRSGEGHAHLHVYLLSPFLPHELVRLLWGRALQRHGYAVPTREISDVLDGAVSRHQRTQLERLLVTRRGPKGRLLEEVPWPVVDIRACDQNVERELVKYLVKDAELEEGKLKFHDPVLGARIYEGLEGVRAIAKSCHFVTNEDRVCACEKCGSTRLARRIVRPEQDAGPVPEGEDG